MDTSLTWEQVGYPKYLFKMEDVITFGDLFAGGGGTSSGAFLVPGVHVIWALNHDEIAIKTHGANHKETEHFQADIRTQNELELSPVDVVWASLECTEHSKAKGGKLKNIGSFTLGWELHRYIVHCNPSIVIIENVPEFVRWGELKDGKRVKNKEGLEYIRWVQSIKNLGYINYDKKFLNAADYGCPTRRVRYFGVFSKLGVNIVWPIATHAEKENLYGLPKWKACRDYLDLKNEGNSIFGREFNENIKKGKRVPLVHNTLRRIAGGIKKFAPELYFIMKYYGNSVESNDFNCQSLDGPIHTIRTKDSHTIIKIEKFKFIQDYCFGNTYQIPEEPLNSVLTHQTKQLVTVEKTKFISNGNYGGSENKISDIDDPIDTLTTQQRFQIITIDNHLLMDGYNRDNVCSPINKPTTTVVAQGEKRLITTKVQFVSQQNNSNGAPEANNASIDNPLNSMTTQEKFQFITTYFNSGGNPESQNSSIDKPLGSLTAVRNKKALITAVANDLVDFDVKMRFVTEDELASIMGFKDGYFKKDNLKLSKKKIVEMVGNSVPVGMAEALIRAVTNNLRIVHNFNNF